MVYKVEQIKRDVRVLLDQNRVSDALLLGGDVDTLSIDEIIESRIEDGVRRVVMLAPSYLLEEGHWFGDEVFRRKDGSGWILLPDDFMRLIEFRMSDWNRSVYKAIGEDDPKYKRQNSRYRGVRGTVQKPVCAIVNRPEGKVLEYYSCKNDDVTVERATYVPFPKIDDKEGIDISEHIYPAVTYYIAGLVANVIGEMERGEIMFKLGKSLIA